MRGAIKSLSTGETLVEVPHEDMLALHGAQRFQVHRADLHEALYRAVLSGDEDCIHLGFCFDRVRQNEPGVTLCFDNGQEVPCRSFDWC